MEIDTPLLNPLLQPFKHASYGSADNDLYLQVLAVGFLALVETYLADGDDLVADLATDG